MYAPGFINPDAEQRIDAKHMEELTGIRLGMRNEKYLAGFKICDMTHPLIQRLEKGHIYGRICVIAGFTY